MEKSQKNLDENKSYIENQNPNNKIPKNTAINTKMILMQREI
jgi:hypothetical protein